MSARAAMALLLGLLPAAAARAQPNLLVILSDDQGWGDLGLHGNPDLRTPNLDGLARAGARCTQFFVCPVCSPTRAEFLTGRYHPRGGVYSTSAGGERLDLDERTIAEVFKAAGYATGAFGKWHNGTQPPYHPNSRGFDEFYGFCSGHWGHYFSPMLEHNGAVVQGNGFVADDFTDRAIAFIEAQVRKKRPFFAYLPYNTPHSPMQVPDVEWGRFADRELARQGRQRQDPAHTRAALALCENIDRNVGRLLRRLDALGVAGDTIVVFFHDNGPNGWRWNGGLRGRKGSTDEGGVRSPLFIRWPGHIEAGREVPQVSGAIDLLPTLADLAGLAPRGGKPLDGCSLKPLLLGAGPWPARTVFSHWRGKVSARTDRYRLDDRGRLYDMVADPGQTKDVSKARPAVAARLRDEVARFRKEVLAELDPKAQRPFTVGYGARTWLPARDAVAHGGLRRSNRFPNCSHFTHWTSTEDRLTWDVEVKEAGAFAVELHYTCPAADVGATLQLRCGDATLEAKVDEAFDPPYVGSTMDRVPRMESDEKAFRPLRLGTIALPAGRHVLTLRATSIPGNAAPDFRMLVLVRE